MAAVSRSQSILLGFPRIGSQRELKKSLESFWSGVTGPEDLLRCGKELRQRHWLLQKQAGVEHVPCNDFSFYDHILDTTVLLGLEPLEYRSIDDALKRYFAMARGERTTQGLPALEMTKWFDTNYHYIVPVLKGNQSVQINTQKMESEFKEAQALGCKPRVVLTGPMTFVTLSKGDDAEKWNLLPAIVQGYQQVIATVKRLGGEWIQWDEPCLSLDSTPTWRQMFQTTYQTLIADAQKQGLKSLITSCFGPLQGNADILFSTGADAIHIDLVRAPEDFSVALKKIHQNQILSLGLVDGRNIWKHDLQKSLSLLAEAVVTLGAHRVWVGSSCSLLHVPVDLERETKIDKEALSWMSFAKQKIEEICFLTRSVSLIAARSFQNGDSRRLLWDSADQDFYDANVAAVAARKASPRIHNEHVTKRVSQLNENDVQRHSRFHERKIQQSKVFQLPSFPTTTIGSFPQTAEVRKMRALAKANEVTAEQYDLYLKKEIAETIRFQEDIGIDVLVHGEYERNDMVEYFGEQLEGFLHTANGWVQSYGSRCVKPPVIFGDVQRLHPMTVSWSAYAQSLTSRPVKGMLTGPVTLLQWAFVRDDLPRYEVCAQLALAVRDEVQDLEKAGITMIQIDEPAFREGLPLRHNDREAYLNWAVRCFKIASCGVSDSTQVHTHMCYSEFNDIMPAIAALDADVISIETSRSQMELLQAFVDFKYPNSIGPGVYDIHSPRVPDESEMTTLLRRALQVLAPEQIWVNPDCGLKTRGWAEVKPALEKMVAAACYLRQNAAANT